MGKLIAVVGNTGVGKTTFVQQLCKLPNFTSGLEQHEERPFHELFSSDKHRFALPNQIDFLLLRAEQEIEIRSSDTIGVQDGGLEEDFFLFTRLFYEKGYLTTHEFDLCERAYRILRHILPPPDLFIWLRAPIGVVAKRYQQRDRRIDIAKIEDMALLERLMGEWLRKIAPNKIITIDTESEDKGYSNSIQRVLERLRSPS